MVQSAVLYRGAEAELPERVDEEAEAQGEIVGGNGGQIGSAIVVEIGQIVGVVDVVRDEIACCVHEGGREVAHQSRIGWVHCSCHVYNKTGAVGSYVAITARVVVVGQSIVAVDFGVDKGLVETACRVCILGISWVAGGVILTWRDEICKDNTPSVCCACWVVRCDARLVVHESCGSIPNTQRQPPRWFLWEWSLGFLRSLQEICLQGVKRKVINYLTEMGFRGNTPIVSNSKRQV